jgi:hypothetical protein
MEGQFARLEFIVQLVSGRWMVSCQGQHCGTVASFGDALASAEAHAEQCGAVSHVVHVVIHRDGGDARPQGQRSAWAGSDPATDGTPERHGPEVLVVPGAPPQCSPRVVEERRWGAWRATRAG